MYEIYIGGIARTQDVGFPRSLTIASLFDFSFAANPLHRSGTAGSGFSRKRP